MLASLFFCLLDGVDCSGFLDGKTANKLLTKLLTSALFLFAASFGFVSFTFLFLGVSCIADSSEIFLFLFCASEISLFTSASLAFAAVGVCLDVSNNNASFFLLDSDNLDCFLSMFSSGVEKTDPSLATLTPLSLLALCLDEEISS